jgi:hypothetical protein
MVVKVVEIIGESEKSYEHAVQQAVSEASKTIRNISGVDVINFTAKVEDGKITMYKANCKLAFKVE